MTKFAQLSKYLSASLRVKKKTFFAYFNHILFKKEIKPYKIIDIIKRLKISVYSLINVGTGFKHAHIGICMYICMCVLLVLYIMCYHILNFLIYNNSYKSSNYCSIIKIFLNSEFVCLDL